MENQTIITWPNEIYVKPQSFFNALLLSSAPFLATILVIFIVFALLSRIFTIRKKYKRRQFAHKMKILEDDLILYTYNQQPENDRALADEYVKKTQQHEKEKKFKLTGRRKEKNRLQINILPDEDKCPIEFLNDALAKNNLPIDHSKNPSDNQADNSDKVEIDQDVVQYINDLINPKFNRQVSLDAQVKTSKPRDSKVTLNNSHSDSQVAKEITKESANNDLRTRKALHSNNDESNGKYVYVNENFKNENPTQLQDSNHIKIIVEDFDDDENQQKSNTSQV